MNKSIQKKILLLFLLAGLFSASSSPDKKFFQMSNFEIERLIKETSGKKMTVSQKINFYSNFFLGTPYDFNCVGDGPYALYEPWPLVNFSKTNCMAFCEHVLALAISDNWDDFFSNLQAIRYKDGLVGMKTRNHYTMADWLPQNSWLLTDVAKKIAGDSSREVTRTISHKKFFMEKGITDITDVIEDRTMTIDYIPFESLINFEQGILSGDICAVIFTDRPGIFTAHMFIIAENDNKKVVRQASDDRMTTYDIAFEVWVKMMRNKSKEYCGISIMRVRPELDNPERIIKPQEIPELKKRAERTVTLNEFN